MTSHNRHSMRLKGYDYVGAGAYFITLVAWQHRCIFGRIIDGKIFLNQAGKIVEMEWQRLKDQFPQSQLGEFVIMPNHFHGILIITDLVGATRLWNIQSTPENKMDAIEATNKFDGSPLQKARPTGPCKGSMGAIIAQFKSQVTKKIWKNCRPDQQPIWQRNYYDHIIRNQDELQKITDYIQMNPVNWEADEEYSS